MWHQRVASRQDRAEAIGLPRVEAGQNRRRGGWREPAQEPGGELGIHFREDRRRLFGFHGLEHADKARDVFLYVISGHKVANPAAAEALIARIA